MPEQPPVFDRLRTLSTRAQQRAARALDAARDAASRLSQQRPANMLGAAIRRAARPTRAVDQRATDALEALEARFVALSIRGKILTAVVALIVCCACCTGMVSALGGGSSSNTPVALATSSQPTATERPVNTAVLDTPVPVPTDTVGPTPTDTPLPPTPQPTATDTPGPEWVTIQHFTGNGAQKTAVFSVPFDVQWRITWACNPSSSFGGSYNVIVGVYNFDGTTLDPVAVNTICQNGNTGGTTYEYSSGEGDLYLDVNSEARWSLDVQAFE